MTKKDLVKKYFILKRDSKKLEKKYKKLGENLKKILPEGMSIWGHFRVHKTLVEEHTVPEYTVREHFNLTVNPK